MRNPSKKHLSIELLLLFVIYPISLSLHAISTCIKLSSTLLILCYLIFVSYQFKLFKRYKTHKPIHFWRTTLYKLILIALSSGLYVCYLDKASLFKPVLTQPKVWIQFVLIYSFLSVVPQEFIYRSFYFRRYQPLFKHQFIFLMLNIIVFSLAHILFKSGFILGITLIGGALFTYTYQKTKSILWVSIEHAIYGSWLFTIGMGKMLGFPI